MGQGCCRTKVKKIKIPTMNSPIKKIMNFPVQEDYKKNRIQLRQSIDQKG